MSDTHEKYASLDKKVYMTLDEAVDLSRELGRRFGALDPKPDLAVGLANGALLTTKVAAEEGGLPFHMVKVRRQGSRIKQRLVLIKRLLKLPPGLLAWHPVGVVSRAFDRRFGKIEGGGDAFAVDVAGKTVLIVDDCIDTGSSVKHVRQQMMAAGAKHVHTAVLCWSASVDSQKMHGVAPTLYLHRRVHYYPWSNNSPFYPEFLGWLKQARLELWT